MAFKLIKMKLKFGLAIFMFLISSPLFIQKDAVKLADGYYRFPNVSRVVMYYKVNGNKISLFRSHAGHYAAMGTYKVDLKDSLLIINYNKTIASKQFQDIEPFTLDTLKLAVNDQNELCLFGLTKIASDGEKFYHNFSKIILNKSRVIK